MNRKSARYAFGMVLLSGLIAVMVTACASGISRQARSQVTYTQSFGQLQAEAAALIGEIVMYGGRIIETHNRDGVTEVMVLQLPLDSKQRPVAGDQSMGRFLLVSEKFLDPALYAKGAHVTAVGQLESVETHLIDQLEYAYPKINATEIKLWPPDELWGGSPRIRFGVGIGTTF